MLNGSHGCTLAAAGGGAEPSTPTPSVVKHNWGNVTARPALTWPEHLEHLGRVKTNCRFDIVLYKLCCGWAPQQQTSLFVGTDALRMKRWTALPALSLLLCGPSSIFPVQNQAEVCEHIGAGRNLIMASCVSSAFHLINSSDPSSKYWHRHDPAIGASGGR